MKIVFTGGGTGGHLMPIIAIARELKKLYPKTDLKMHYIGPKDTSGLLPKEGIRIHKIMSGKIRRYHSYLGFFENADIFIFNIADLIFNIPIGFLQSFFLLLFLRPKLVFSKGGTGSLPVTYCSKLLRIPVFLHESDAVPGKSNKITSKWAKKIFVSFKKTEYFDSTKTTLVGNPIRLAQASAMQVIKEAIGRSDLPMASEKPVILILGGSQGSESINEFILVILNNLLEGYEIIHIAGEKNYKKVGLGANAITSKDLMAYYHLYGSLEEVKLKQAYEAADLVVSRAGSGSIFEIAAFGKPSILIPLPWSAHDHQSKNAYQYAKTGAAIVIEQNNLTPNFFLGQVDHLLSNPNKMKKMSEAALNFAEPEAAKVIAKEIIEYLK